MTLSDNDLQMMYQTVQDTVFPDTCTILNSGSTILHTGVRCLVSSAQTAIEFDQTAQTWDYEGVYTVKVPKWVTVEIGYYVDVLGMKLLVKNKAAPKSNQMSITLTCNDTGSGGSTSDVVPPYDLLSRDDNPITSGGVGIRLQ